MPGMFFPKSSGQLGVLLGTSPPSGPAELLFNLGIPEVSLPKRVWKSFRSSGPPLPMIASVLAHNASEHRFRCSQALLQMVSCRHIQHCFQTAFRNGLDEPRRLHPKTLP